MFTRRPHEVATPDGEVALAASKYSRYTALTPPTVEWYLSQCEHQVVVHRVNSVRLPSLTAPCRAERRVALPATACRGRRCPGAAPVAGSPGRIERAPRRRSSAGRCCRAEEEEEEEEFQQLHNVTEITEENTYCQKIAVFLV